MSSFLIKQLMSLPPRQFLDIFDSLFNEATEGIMIEDADRTVIAVNRNMLRFLGMDEEDVIGQNSSTLAYSIGESCYATIDNGIRSEGAWRGELEIMAKEGGNKLAWVSVDAIVQDGALINNVIMVTDISEIKQSRQQLEHIATHDTLTDLPNRVLLYDRLDVSIKRVQRSDSLGAVIFLNIDNFKDVNDNFGHAYGDELLKICADMLTLTLRSKDTVGRLGGDEFLIIIDEFYALEDIEGVAKKLLALFDQLIKVRDVEFDLSVSMGISVYPYSGTEVEKLINEADIAMSHVKQMGRNNYGFYSPELSEQSHEIFRVGRGIKQALRNDSFYMVYQPQLSLSSGNLMGVEALLRCRESCLEETSIEGLIEVAEKSSMIIEMGKRIFELVCEQISIWNRQGYPSCLVAVNLSRRQLSDRRLVEMVQETVERYGVTVDQIEFEITESSLIQSHVLAQENMQRLRELGFCFSIDDFGTGYSSLSNLRNFSLDKLKIDRSFISELEKNRHDRIIVEATINMAKSLGLVVLAEGVETEAQAEILRSFGCDQMQGYLFSKPISAKAFETLKVHERSPSRVQNVREQEAVNYAP
ncbi:MAG: EAL domain-containing protein [Campylobacterota bacterium]